MDNLDSKKEEFLDIVNEEDQVVDSRSRDEIHHLGLLHREVHVWLFDKEKNIYFQKSGPHKTSAGLLDSSIGGHVDMGEKYVDAAIRETKEESGISLLESDLVFLFKFRNVTEHKKKGVVNNFIRAIYIYKNPITDEDIREEGDTGSGGFKKFSFKYLENMKENDRVLFHKFVPTHELPHVLKYVNISI